MRSIRLQFEIKLVLVLGAVLLVVLFFGSGNLSFAEAKAKAYADRSSFSAGQLSKLEKFQARFAEKAFPPCQASTGIVPGNFTVIIEVGLDGRVARSWRRGDSAFVVCFQQLMTENFFFISMGQPFFTLFEYSIAP
ncbi:MAG TPA: hypothetical protein VMZ32_02790 [Gammaproteobacteria bacterium]|nr:hypothetical protein [Gammaproteobacteria bacterium]